jgi:hypothetical protein
LRLTETANRQLKIANRKLEIWRDRISEVEIRSLRRKGGQSKSVAPSQTSLGVKKRQYQGGAAATALP